MSTPTQKVGRNTRLRLVFLPTLLSCYRRFVRALHLHTGAQSRLLYYLTGLCGNMLLILLVSRKCVTEEPTKSPFHNTVLCNPIVEHGDWIALFMSRPAITTGIINISNNSLSRDDKITLTKLSAYAFLTKREVEMAGYGPSSFSLCVLRRKKRNEANIQLSWQKNWA